MDAHRRRRTALQGRKVAPGLMLRAQLIPIATQSERTERRLFSGGLGICMRRELKRLLPAEDIISA